MSDSQQKETNSQVNLFIISLHDNNHDSSSILDSGIAQQLFEKLKLKMTSVRKFDVKPFIPYNCTIVDTLKISKPFDVKISYSNRYFVGPYCNGPQYLCVEDESQYLEESGCYKSDALIFSHTLYTIDSTQRLSKFNLHQLVEQEEDDVRKTTTPIWEIELGNGFINGIVNVGSRIYVPFNASIQILNSKTGDKLDTIYTSPLFGMHVNSQTKELFTCADYQIIFLKRNSK